MKAEILKMLRESGDYVSGQQLCDELGVSRTAVWKVINQLKEDGYEVEAVRNRGYRIAQSPDLLSKEEILSQMQTEWAGKEVCYLEKTDSTNIRARQLGDGGAPHGTLVVAKQQSAGRGRRGRSWDSPEGDSIYMTLLLRPDCAPNEAPMLTLVMAYSVAKAIKDCGIDGVQIKWPNDLVMNGKKICGILTEMSTEIDYINHVVIGVGINVNMEHFPEEISRTATSLRIETGHPVRRSPLIAACMKRFEENYERFMEKRDLSPFREEYNRMLVNCGRQVRVLGAKESYEAFALGINDTGELAVRRGDGRIEEIFAGEVSVRGVYGYV